MAVAPETRGAILLGDALPTVPQLLSRHGLDRPGAAEAEAWWDSWSLTEAEGTSLRKQVYPSAAAWLLPVLGRAGVEDLLARGAQTLVAADGVATLMDSADLREALARTRGLFSHARRAMEAGNTGEALELFLEASDALWKLTPRPVATDLLAHAREALRRNPDDGTYSQEKLIRIKRLIYGASEALDAGDYPGAIRRAYYACQLLGVSPP